MHDCTTILGVIAMRQRGISYDDCRNRYGIGNSTITLIMNRFKDSGKDLEALKQMLNVTCAILRSLIALSKMLLYPSCAALRGEDTLSYKLLTQRFKILLNIQVLNVTI